MARRTGLLPKYAMSFMVLVGGAVMVAGLIDLGVGYRASYEAHASVQRAEVRAAAVRIATFLDGIRAQLQDVSGLPWSSGLMGLQERREEYQRLIKLVPAIAELRAVDARGIERLRASRQDLDEVEPRRRSGANELLVLARERGSHYSATYFQGLEPYITLAVRDRDPEGPVTLAQLNLRAVGEVVGQIHVGRTGRVYVVDSADNLVAHPNANLVLRDRKSVV